jgi:hypothetical protein
MDDPVVVVTGNNSMPRNPNKQRPVHPVPHEAVYMSPRQLRRRYGDVSHMWIERRLKNDPDFPRPEYFGPQRFFKICAIEAYERLCAARQRQKVT